MTYKVPELFKDYEDTINKSLRKANEITFTLEDTKPWDSKLGGCPYLESIQEYPLGKNGKPMIFLAQINLSDLVELEDMPEEGLLQFFINNDDCYGFDAPCEVRYIENYIKDESRLVLENPYEKEYADFLPFNKNGKMNFELREMPITCSCEDFDKAFAGKPFTEEQEEEAWEEFDGEGSRVAGYPYFVQAEPEFYGEYDILLLQLDVEDNCGIMFGDSGNCNFFISKQDLENRDFSKVQYDWQCC